MKVQLVLVAALTALYTTVFVFTGDVYWFLIGGLASALLNLALRHEVMMEEKVARAWAKYRLERRTKE